MMKVFGPVPSRRLGQSLGINNIPPKFCTYSCAYCQLGHTKKVQIERREFYKPAELVAEVEEKIKKAAKVGEKIDYMTFVADGEPTLDINLGAIIDGLKPLGIKIAVINNSSLIWREDVRNDLLKADWVSLKVDSLREEIWRKIDRPHRALKLDSILEGILAFAKVYKGQLMTETMLVKGINDEEEYIKEIADFLAKLNPNTSYLSIPIRPPAEACIQAADETFINQAYQIISEKVSNVEYLIGYEGNAFAFTGNVKEDILSITAVHPMRQDAIDDFLVKANATWNVINDLLKEEKIFEIKHDKNTFYMRNIGLRR